jgi:GNAT superfamily N-acetyltransferase
MSRTRNPAPAPRIVAERSGARAMSRRLWDGLLRYNRKTAGPFHYSRVVLTVRSPKGPVLGGLILQSYWKESYVELLWLSERARRQGYGRLLIQEAERRARRRGSRLLHLNTYSFQAPGFYEKLGFTRFGGMEGSPPGASRHFYVKRLTGGRTP